jgi:hypothetical protein
MLTQRPQSLFVSLSLNSVKEGAMMRWNWFVASVLVFAVALCLGTACPLQAEPIASSDGSGTSANTSHPQYGDGWVVEGATGGIQDVYYDPTAGPWIKHLAPINGGALVGTVYTLTELLHVGGGPNGVAPAWTDYHEELRTPGWTWSPVGPNGENVWGFSAANSNPNGPDWNGVWTYVIPMGNTKVDWTFRPPLPVCTNVTFTKYVVFNGGVNVDPFAPLTVAQWPTVPEPGTLGLLATGLAMLLGYGWRRSR